MVSEIYNADLPVENSNLYYFSGIKLSEFLETNVCVTLRFFFFLFRRTFSRICYLPACVAVWVHVSNITLLCMVLLSELNQYFS